MRLGTSERRLAARLRPIVLLAVYRFIIRREERYLAGAFGPEYAAYRNDVRRWP